LTKPGSDVRVVERNLSSNTNEFEFTGLAHNTNYTCKYMIFGCVIESMLFAY